MINAEFIGNSYPSTSGVSSSSCFARSMEVSSLETSLDVSSFFPSNKAQGTAMAITNTTTTTAPITTYLHFIIAVLKIELICHKTVDSLDNQEPVDAICNLIHLGKHIYHRCKFHHIPSISL